MALLMPIVYLPTYLYMTLKLLIGVLMVLIAFKTESLKKFALQFIIFISCTALFGGICFLVYYLSTGNMNFYNLVVNNYSFPIVPALAIVFVYFLFVKGVIKYIINKQRSKKFMFEIIFYSKDKKIKTMAYLDSGHKLSDPKTHESVIIINYNLFAKLFKIPIEQILMKKIPQELENAHYIKISTINNKDQDMLVFNVDKVQINLIKNKVIRKNAPLGLSFTKYNKNFNCDVLIGPELI